MPNRWESSGRPLFVRTVFVNGSRHAVLFEEDPLGNSHLKKISRSNSSLSFGSDLSLTSSESQDSNSEERVDGGERRDLSSELQSCLIKLRLASGSKSDGEKCCCHPKGRERSRQEVSGEGKRRGKRDQSCRRKSCGELQEEQSESKSLGRRVARGGSCYFYNFDSTNRKKKYCVVKISSQPPEFTESCTCRGCPSAGKMVISATIHNLLMTSRKERLSGHNAFLYENPDSIDLCWDTYLTKSCYNSLSDRVFQWLDLTSKRKSQNRAVESTPEGDSSNSIERICSGKTFIGESKKTEWCDDNKQRNKAKRETKNEDIETEVMGEPNITTVLSKETAENDSTTCLREQTTPLSKESAVASSIPAGNDPKPSQNSPKTCAIRHLNSGKSLKVQDLLLDYDWREKIGMSLGKRSKRRMREIRDSWRSESSQREAESTEEEGESVGHWEERIFGRSGKCGERARCRWSGSAEGHAEVKTRLPTAGFRERSEKSINNLNFTRGRPVLIRDLLPSQQRDDMVSPRTEKTVWGSEKGTGRLQLHIFMPTVVLKEGSDDSTSECENVLNLC